MRDVRSGSKINILLRILNIQGMIANIIMGFILSIQMSSRGTYEDISSSIFKKDVPLMNSNALEFFFRKDVGIFIVLVLVAMLIKEVVFKSF